jgi:signal transduction histidine kinase
VTDEPDERRDQRSSNTDPHGLSWPLVERRQSRRPPTSGIDRRDRSTDQIDGPPLAAAPLWPFRVAALIGALIGSASQAADHRWGVMVIASLAVVYTVVACMYPVPYRNDPGVRSRIVGEQALNVVAVVLTGAWTSPFVLFFIPTGMLAGFAAGAIYSAAISLTAVVFASATHIAEVGWGTGLRDSALWAALLAVVAYTTGLTRRSALESARRQEAAADRVSQLAEANQLLFALQRVAQSMPASLDLDEVLDSTLGRLRSMVPHDSIAVYLVEGATDRAVLARSSGVRPVSTWPMNRLPAGPQAAAVSPKPVRLDNLGLGTGVDPAARSGVYAGLRARGSLIGLVAVESHRTDAFDAQQTEVVHGLSEPFGIAIDNARLFQSIRTLAADEERMRIARDLHDHVGSSLALIGFEVDRAISAAAAQGDVEPTLRHVREQVTAVVSDVRDTLYDLRTDVSDRSDLTHTIGDFLRRVQQRSGIATHSDVRLDHRLPTLIEREVWQMVREAVMNAERHSRATELVVATAPRADGGVVLTVTDNGVGLGSTTPRPDSYGLVGMRERALRIEATLTVASPADGGTEVRIELPGGLLE